MPQCTPLHPTTCPWCDSQFSTWPSLWLSSTAPVQREGREREDSAGRRQVVSPPGVTIGPADICNITAEEPRRARSKAREGKVWRGRGWCRSCGFIFKKVFLSIFFFKERRKVHLPLLQTGRKQRGLHIEVGLQKAQWWGTDPSTELGDLHRDSECGGRGWLV